MYPIQSTRILKVFSNFQKWRQHKWIQFLQLIFPISQLHTFNMVSDNVDLENRRENFSWVFPLVVPVEEIEGSPFPDDRSLVKLIIKTVGVRSENFAMRLHGPVMKATIDVNTNKLILRKISPISTLKNVLRLLLFLRPR